MSSNRPQYSGARASHLWRDPVRGRPAWWGAGDDDDEKDDGDDEKDDDDVDEVLWYLLVSRLALDDDVDLNYFQVSC